MKPAGQLTVSAQEYRTVELVKLLKPSARELQNWDEQRILMPRREGHKRIYSFEQAITAGILWEFRRLGFSLVAWRRNMRGLERELSKHVPSYVGVKLQFVYTHKGKSLQREMREWMAFERKEDVADYVLDRAREPRTFVAVINVLEIMDSLQKVPAR